MVSLKRGGFGAKQIISLHFAAFCRLGVVIIMHIINEERIITKKFLQLREILGLNQATFAYLFQMSRQAFSKLEKCEENAKMNFSTIFVIFHILDTIVEHENFKNMNEEQKEAIIEVKEDISIYLNKKTKYTKVINDILY